MFYCSWAMTHCRLGRSSAASTASIHNARCVLRSTLTLTTACIIGDCADNEALTPFSNPLRFLAIFNKSLITLAFTFRKLTSDHAIEWQTLKLEGVEDFPLEFLITPEEALKTTKGRARTHLNFGTTRGVFYHNTSVGFCGYRPELFERTRHRAQIGPFFVRPKYQGTGAAQCLMSGVIQEARAAKIAQLELFVDTEDYRAIRFNEKYGFEWVATHPDGVRMGAQSRDDHFYCLRLGP